MVIKMSITTRPNRVGSVAFMNGVVVTDVTSDFSKFFDSRQNMSISFDDLNLQSDLGIQREYRFQNY